MGLNSGSADKLPNSKNSGENKPQTGGGSSQKQSSGSDKVRQQVSQRVASTVLNKK